MPGSAVLLPLGGEDPGPGPAGAAWSLEGWRRRDGRFEAELGFVAGGGGWKGWKAALVRGEEILCPLRLARREGPAGGVLLTGEAVLPEDVPRPGTDAVRLQAPPRRVERTFTFRFERVPLPWKD